MTTTAQFTLARVATWGTLAVFTPDAGRAQPVR
ncbi:hypothetical protein H4V99_002681 [Cryobacterium sp. CG_9.6]|nr:hypothetical protein [Cryobacterium sp. CG_9.6]